MTRRNAMRAVTAHRHAATLRRQVEDSVITLANYTEHVRLQRIRAARREEDDRAAGVVVLTELSEAQLLEGRRDEALMWPARWW